MYDMIAVKICMATGTKSAGVASNGSVNFGEY